MTAMPTPTDAPEVLSVGQLTAILRGVVEQCFPDVWVAGGEHACNPGTEAAPAAWSSLDGGVRAAAFPWALAVSDPRRQVSWLAGQGLMHAFPGCPSG